MAKKQSTDAAPAPAPEPTHGGMYELVDGQLRAIEGGGPPASMPAADAPAQQPTGEGT